MADTTAFCMTPDQPDEQEIARQRMCADLVMRIMDDMANEWGPAAALAGVSSAMLNFMVCNMKRDAALQLVNKLPEAFRHSEKVYKDAQRRAAN